MKHGNNSAERLLIILRECKERRKKEAGKRLFDVWRSMFQMLPNSQDWYVMDSLALFSRLPLQIIEEAKRFGEGQLPKEIYLDWQSDLMNVCSSIAVTAVLQQFIDPISEVSLKSLAACAHQFSLRYPEKVVQEQDISTLRQEVSMLQSAILSADMPSELQRYLLDHIGLIQTALDHYPIIGSSGLKTAVDACIGSVLTSNDLYNQSMKEADGQGFWKLAERIALIVQYSEYGYKLLTYTKSLTDLLK